MANAIQKNNIIYFNDINLEQVIREKINKPYQVIRVEDVIEIKELDLSGKNPGKASCWRLAKRRFYKRIAIQKTLTSCTRKLRVF